MSTRRPRTAHRIERPTLSGLLSALAPGPRRALDAALRARPRTAVWLVGGAVRDLALGRPLVDVDLGVEGDPRPLAQAAARALDGTVETYEAFGTASARGAAGRLDFARLRAEVYERPGALPVPVFGVPIEQDLERRDFSVNALALGLAGPRIGEVVDPCGGFDDLERGALRVLHDGSFRDDATRLWRGARYATRLGLRPDPHTRTLIVEGARWLAPISGERLWAEFERVTAERLVGATLALLDAWGTLEGTCRGFHLAPASRRALRGRFGPLPPEVVLAVLLAPLPARDEVANRLSAPRAARRAVADASRLLEAGEPIPDVLAALEGLSEDGRTAARWLEPRKQRPLQYALRRWERTRAPLSGHDLEALGVPQGAAIGEWLRQLRAARYVEGMTPAAARRAVRRSLGVG